ncbi:MAG: hypothetical protein KatS3mg032_0765 [Cyclobacteriaceae bacterium]|nr:MAG: hypothetical protein KatS3mg032_0765 [Cyclobacteriaceae bacterium]
MTTLTETGRLNEALAATIHPQNSLQREALEEFLRTGLPHSKNEEYKYTPIARVLEKNFNPSLPLATEGTLPDENLWRIHAAGAYAVVFLKRQISGKALVFARSF